MVDGRGRRLGADEGVASSMAVWINRTRSLGARMVTDPAKPVIDPLVAVKYTPSKGLNKGSKGPISLVSRWWHLKSSKAAPVDVFICNRSRGIVLSRSGGDVAYKVP